jgi:probable F420-dependent oxidoreductase
MESAMTDENIHPAAATRSAEPDSSRLSVRVGVTWVGRDPADLWPVVDELEAGGWDSIWLPDLSPLGGIAPLPLLAAVAARTSRLKLGTNAIVLPGRNPVLLARELAAIDALSTGRLLPTGALGLTDPEERRAMGVGPGERAARLEESVQVLRALWAGGRVSHAGRFWSFSDVELTPRPRRPRLELWLGGRAPAALRRIGRIADGWLASTTGPEAVEAGIATIRAAAAEAGRTIDEDHYGATIHAVRRADGISPVAEHLVRLHPEVDPAGHVAHGPEGLRELLARFIDAGATKFVLVPHADDVPGWLAELRETIAPFEAAGAPHPVGSTAHGRDERPSTTGRQTAS